MNKSVIIRGRSHVAALAAIIGGFCLASSAANAAKPTASTTDNATYSGQAVALRIDGTIDPPGPIIIADTGQLASTGGALSATGSAVNILNGALTVDTADADATGIGPQASADARLTKFHCDVKMSTMDIIIEADYIAAAVDASSNPGGVTNTDATVTVQNLTVNGRAVAVTGQANQVVDFPDIDTHLVINEQVASSQKGDADVQVTALHFKACDVQGTVCQVHSGLTITGKPPSMEHEECGKVTGGGWIITPSGAKGTFGMSGGIRRGEYWGHLTFIDHGTGMKVESSAVTGFQVDPNNSLGRIITYAVSINGASGTATLRVVDNGEPGRNDIFDLTLSTGYHAAGDLGGAGSGGGNIQLHKCPPGWE